MKMNPKTLFLSIIFLICLPFTLQAAVIEQVYEVTLPVVNQHNNVRNAAFEQGLVEVSIRVSGNSQAPAKIDLKKAPSLVSQYRYQQLSEAQINAYRKSKSGAVPNYMLWMQFDEDRIQQLLKQQQLPVWGKQRPGVIVWMAVMDGKNRYLLKQSDRSQIKDALNDEARRRGLPIIWPRLDQADKEYVSFSDVWGRFQEPVRSASRNYSADAILMGRMNWVGGSWVVDWSLYLEDRIEDWKISAVDLDRIMGSGIGVATDSVSSRFAVFANQASHENLQIRVTGMNNLDKYVRVTSYLASLAPVKHVFATEVHPDYVDFQLDLNGGAEDLRRIIALGRLLTPDNRPIQVPALSSNGSSQNSAVIEANGKTVVAPAETVVPVTPALPVMQYRVNG